MPNEQIDIATLSDEEIRKAFANHCDAMGSRPYCYRDELERWKSGNFDVVVFRDGYTELLRAYTKVRSG